MTKNISTARSAYKRNLEALVSAQSKAALQAAGTAGKSAMNAAAGTVNAQIDTGTLDGAAYAAQLAKGIAEIKAAQQKQLEEQLKQQAKEIAAR